MPVSQQEGRDEIVNNQHLTQSGRFVPAVRQWICLMSQASSRGDFWKPFSSHVTLQLHRDCVTKGPTQRHRLSLHLGVEQRVMSMFAVSPFLLLAPWARSGGTASWVLCQRSHRLRPGPWKAKVLSELVVCTIQLPAVVGVRSHGCLPGSLAVLTAHLLVLVTWPLTDPPTWASLLFKASKRVCLTFRTFFKGLA